MRWFASTQRCDVQRFARSLARAFDAALRCAAFRTLLGTRFRRSAAMCSCAFRTHLAAGSGAVGGVRLAEFKAL
jgi:hypothetical protein